MLSALFHHLLRYSDGNNPVQAYQIPTCPKYPMMLCGYKPHPVQHEVLLLAVIAP